MRVFRMIEQENEEIENKYCEVCGKYLNKDGVCNDCGLPTKEIFLKALEQAVLKFGTIEVSIEDTEKQLSYIELELKNIQDSKIPPDIKAEFVKRLESEIEWLNDFIADEKGALDYYELQHEEEYYEQRQKELK